MKESGEYKAVLRKKINKLLLHLLPHEKKKADSCIVKALLSRPEIIQSQTICTYVSFGTEVDTRQLIAKLLEIGKIVVVPKIRDDGLELYTIHALSDLEEGIYGIPEPTNSCKVVDKSAVDLFIVPGIAFDKKGHRLGRGHGYYDKLLQGITAAKIGLAYSFQVIAEVPHTSYDVPITALVMD